MYRRVDVAEGPLVGGQLPVRMHRPLPARAGRAAPWRSPDRRGRARSAVEGEVPGREPRVLPLVGHRHDVGEGHVLPGRVAAGPALLRRRRLMRVAVEPLARRCTGRAACPTAVRRTRDGRSNRSSSDRRPAARVDRSRRPRSRRSVENARQLAPNMSAVRFAARQPQPDRDGRTGGDGVEWYQNAALVPDPSGRSRRRVSVARRGC